MTANLFVGPCPGGCLYCYARSMRPNVFHKQPQFMDPDSIDKIKKWPDYLFLSSYSEPFLPQVLPVTFKLLERAFAHGTYISISTKRKPDGKITDLLARNCDRVSVSISLSSVSHERNGILEPHVPSAKERPGFADFLTQNQISVWIKADTLFPSLDDTEESISSLSREVRLVGVEKIMLSYIFFRPQWKARLQVPLLEQSLKEMIENQPIASGSGFSLPIKEKEVRLREIGRAARSCGFTRIITCGCKNAINPADIDSRYDSIFPIN